MNDSIKFVGIPGRGNSVCQGTRLRNSPGCASVRVFGMVLYIKLDNSSSRCLYQPPPWAFALGFSFPGILHSANTNSNKFPISSQIFHSLVMVRWSQNFLAWPCRSSHSTLPSPGAWCCAISHPLDALGCSWRAPPIPVFMPLLHTPLPGNLSSVSACSTSTLRGSAPVFLPWEAVWHFARFRVSSK